MTKTDILRHRLANQQIVHTNFTQPGEIVAHMVAIQAQEYAASKWAIGLRLPGIKEFAVEEAINSGTILRTHLLRPTWHLVSPDDIRWILQLTAPRVHAFNAFSYRSEGLDAAAFKKSTGIIAKMLEGNNYLTRNAIAAALEGAKIKATGVRLACLMMYAELEGVICSGPRNGKQFTYALLDERVPGGGHRFVYQEALHALTLRYFSSRWPASVKDFIWWSGLTAKEAKEGINMLPQDFVQQTVDGEIFICKDLPALKPTAGRATFLLPNFDEYGISYKDRSIINSGAGTHHLITKNGGSVPSLVIDGKIAGTWKTATAKKITSVEISTYMPLTTAKQKDVNGAIKRYERFING